MLLQFGNGDVTTVNRKAVTSDNNFEIGYEQRSVQEFDMVDSFSKSFLFINILQSFFVFLGWFVNREAFEL